MVTLISFGLTSCSAPKSSSAPSSEQPATQSPSKKTLDIALVIPSTESQYWGQYIAIGAQNACLDIKEKYGIDAKLTVYGPTAEAETDKFLNILEGVISKKPDAIVLGNLIPDSTAPLVEQAAKAGIYVNLVSLGITDKENSYGTLYYCDQPEQGKLAAEAFVKLLEKKGLPKNGVVGVHMSVVVPILEEKIKNFKDRLKELLPDVQILDTVYNENDVNKAQANVENQISTYGDKLIGFFGGNNISGDGICLAVKNAGIANKIVSVAVDSDDLEIEALRAGNIDALIVQTPYAQAYQATMNCYEYLFNKKSDPKGVNISAKVVTKENMDQEEYKTLLNPLLLKRTP